MLINIGVINRLLYIVITHDRRTAAVRNSVISARNRYMKSAYYNKDSL